MSSQTFYAQNYKNTAIVQPVTQYIKTKRILYFCDEITSCQKNALTGAEYKIYQIGNDQVKQSLLCCQGYSLSLMALHKGKVTSSRVESLISFFPS